VHADELAAVDGPVLAALRRKPSDGVGLRVDDQKLIDFVLGANADRNKPSVPLTSCERVD
jgi:hypothetical protein